MLAQKIRESQSCGNGLNQNQYNQFIITVTMTLPVNFLASNIFYYNTIDTITMAIYFYHITDSVLTFRQVASHSNISRWTMQPQK